MLRLDWYIQVIWSQCEGVISFLELRVNHFLDEDYPTGCHKAAGPTVFYILFCFCPT